MRAERRFFFLWQAPNAAALRVVVPAAASPVRYAFSRYSYSVTPRTVNRRAGVGVCAVVGVRVRRVDRQQQLPVVAMHDQTCWVNEHEVVTRFIVEVFLFLVGTPTFASDTLVILVRNVLFLWFIIASLNLRKQPVIAMRRRRVSRSAR